MKRRKFSWLALLLAVSLVLGQPGIAYATEATDVSGNVATEDVSGNETVSGNEEATEETEEVAEETTEEAAEEVAEEVVAVEEVTTESIVVEEIPEALLKYGFKEMTLSAEQIAEKAEMSEVVSVMSEMTAAKDYAEGEVVFFAETAEEAAKVAESYNGELVEFEYGVGVIKVAADVKEVVAIGANADYALPAVYPNITYTISDELFENGTSDGDELIDEEDVVREEVEEETNGIQLPVKEGTGNKWVATPNDTYYTGQWHLKYVDADYAWNATMGDGSVVAVIDTGIDYTHEDLKANIAGYMSTITNPLYVSDGYDDHGHGTHCAGIIAADSHNGIGVVGVAPAAKIFSIKALNSRGSGSTSDIVQGVVAATSQNVDVISMSLGGIYYDGLFQKAITAAVKKGIVVVAAAGNEATMQKSYPAAYTDVIAVAATQQDYNELTYFSNYGKWVDIAAPGDTILSTLPMDFTIEDVEYAAQGYGYMSGTSMACPVVAGTVALMLANNTELKNTDKKTTVTKITKNLIDSAKQNVPAWTYYYDDPNSYYPMLDANVATYAMDNSVLNAPTIKFSSPVQKNNVVTAGEDEWFELETDCPQAKIYYTINGKKPTPSTAYEYEGGMYLTTSGKVKIQAIAVVGSKQSKVFSQTYKFDVKATDIIDPNFIDTYTVAKGKSIQLDAYVYPSFTSNKKLNWTSSDGTGMIKVDKKGKVTCHKNAQAGLKATITATTTDGSNLSCEFKVVAQEAAIDNLTLNATKLNMSAWADEFTMNMSDGTKCVSEFQLVPQNTGVTTSQYIYKSSNPKVATVNQFGYITPVSKGKATITVTANDGSNKKAKCTVNVVTPVWDIYTYSNTGFSGYSSYIPIGTGCKVTLKTQVNYNITSGYYAATNKKVTWSSSNPAVVDVKNGKVTCSKNAIPGTQVTITAMAADGFGTKQEITFLVTDKITKITYVDPEYLVDTGYSKLSYKGKVGSVIYDPAGGYVNVHTQNGTSKFYEYIDIKVSNPDVVYRTYAQTIYGDLVRVITGTKPGSSKITYTARDGSNTKFTINCKISK